MTFTKRDYSEKPVPDLPENWGKVLTTWDRTDDEGDRYTVYALENGTFGWQDGYDGGAANCELFEDAVFWAEDSNDYSRRMNRGEKDE